MAETRSVKPTASADAPQSIARAEAVRRFKEENAEPISVTYRPGEGDPEETEVFGVKMKAGKSVEIPGKYREKAMGNPYLQVAGAKSFGDSKAEQEEPEEQEVATFDQNLARERTEEYLSGLPLTTNSPGEADRVARAQEQAAELRAAVESDETDKKPKKRG